MKMKMKLNRYECYIFLAVFLIALTSKAAVQTPENFWWGISTASYQTEDQGVSPKFMTDWDVFFQNGHLKEPKGDGTLSYSQFERDLKTLISLGVSHYRFGIEWARVEPEPGKYNQEAFDHYLKMVQELKKHNIVPIICLWHFTFPSWLYNEKDPSKNGWLHPQAMERWQKYNEKVMELFGKQVEYFAPQNEPNAHALASYFLGLFPPGAKYKLSLFRDQIKASAEAFKASSAIVHKHNAAAKIITIQNLVLWEPAWWDLTGYFSDLGVEYNMSHLRQVMSSVDWVGFNYYYQVKASPFPNERKQAPQGIKIFIKQLSEEFHKPIVIMENGIADAGDDVRLHYIKTHIAALEEAKKEGYDVRGYFYWSLIDNFEWAQGYKEKFGLYSLSADKSALLEKPSAAFYRKTISDSKVPVLK